MVECECQRESSNQKTRTLTLNIERLDNILFFFGHRVCNNVFCTVSDNDLAQLQTRQFYVLCEKIKF